LDLNRLDWASPKVLIRSYIIISLLSIDVGLGDVEPGKDCFRKNKYGNKAKGIEAKMKEYLTKIRKRLV